MAHAMHGTACMRVTEDEEQHLEWPIEHSRMGGRVCVVKALGTISLLGSLLVSSVFFNTPSLEAASSPGCHGETKGGWSRCMELDVQEVEQVVRSTML